MIGIYIPTYGRPKKLQTVADNIKQATKNPYKLYWGVEPDDRESILAAKDTGCKVIINPYGDTYSNALQAIYEETTEPIFLWGNDDFHFLDSWDEKPLELMVADSEIGVLGLHDGNPKTSFTSISLIRRKYIEEQSGVIDIPNRVLYPYNHNYVDNELTETAKHRGAWGACDAPCIEHQHHTFTWLGDFPHDDTYKKNDSGFAEDNEMYYSRIHLWS